MAVRTKPVLAVSALLALAACAAEPASTPTPPAAAGQPAETASAPLATTSEAPEGFVPVDAATLPEDVQAFILNQRMCRHFSRPVSEGGNSAMATITCPKADEATWKALLETHQGDETVSSVLLAARPDSTGDAPPAGK